MCKGNIPYSQFKILFLSGTCLEDALVKIVAKYLSLDMQTSDAGPRVGKSETVTG